MNKFFQSVIFLLLFSYSFGQIQSFQLKSGSSEIKQTPIFYYLPKTNIKIEVEVTTDYFIPGPYCDFADKYLFIKNVKTSRKSTSSITNVVLNEYTIPDNDNAFFAIEKNYDYKLSLNNIGILSGYNVAFNNSNTTNFLQTNNQNTELDETIPFFTNYSVKSNFSLLTDTTYKVILVDSVFQKIPVFNKQITSKSLEQKAEEAANYILLIREWKFNLKSGQFDTDIPPTNVPEMLKQLDDLEQNYIELFVGKKVSVTNNFSYDYSPEKEEELPIFYLSDEKGLLNKLEKNAKPVILKIENMKTTETLEKLSKSIDTQKQKVGLYYRNPEIAMVSIIFNNSIISQKQIILPQFGFINFLPQKMFENKNIKIYFDDKSGAVRNISNE